MFVTTVCLLGGGRQLLLGGHKAGSKYYQVPGTCCCRVYRTMVTGIRRPFCFLSSFLRRTAGSLVQRGCWVAACCLLC